MKANIYVTLKNGVLDPQGKTLRHALESMGHTGIKDVRVGKYIEMEFSGEADYMDDEKIAEMCRKVLSNPVIENYRIEKTG